MSTDVLTYCTYGNAVGDGIADDYEAIRKTHEMANITGQTVLADPGKVFNLGRHIKPIVIKTSTVWTDAEFIIDDSEIAPNDPERIHNVFSVEPDNQCYSIDSIKSLYVGDANISERFDTDVLLHVVNEDKRQYIRYGLNQDTGAPQQEILLLRKDGSIDPTTPIMWEYASISKATVYPVSDTPITITGGRFTTIANQAPRAYTYYARGIRITRSNVTVRGIRHDIIGEGDSGAPYSGFVSVNYVNNVLFEDMMFTGHKTYRLATEEKNSMGTYEISATNSNNVTWRRCTQTNDINDNKYWGVMGSNYCKNLTYDGCVLSRFDAHKGTHNASIINSEIGHQKVSIIGSGELHIENTVFHGNHVVVLRGDYGSTWNGNITIKNVKLCDTTNPILIYCNWVNHYFGYDCYLPHNIIIDGVTVENADAFTIFPDLNTGAASCLVGGVKNNNPYMLTKRISVLGKSKEYKISVSQNEELFRNTVIEVK